MGIASFLWGTTFGISMFYTMQPRFYIPLKNNLILPTYSEFEAKEFDTWRTCKTIFHGIHTSIKEF